MYKPGLQVFVPDSGRFDRSKLFGGRRTIPHQPRVRSFNKPQNAFWTSGFEFIIPEDRTSPVTADWLCFSQESNQLGYIGESAGIFRVRPEARILVIPTEEKFLEVAYRYRGVFTDPDWRKVLKDYDGVASSNRGISGWDCISTAWGNDGDGVLELVAEVDVVKPEVGLFYLDLSPELRASLFGEEK